MFGASKNAPSTCIFICESANLRTQFNGIAQIEHDIHLNPTQLQKHQEGLFMSILDIWV